MAIASDATISERQDLAGLVSKYRRYVPLVAGCMVAMMILAGVITQFLPRQYTATVTLTYAPQSNTVEQANTLTSLSDLARDAAIEAQTKLITSLAVAKDVIDRLHLERDPDLAKSAQDFAAGSGERSEAMASALLRSARARRSGSTNLIELSYTDRSPLRAAQIANAFSQEYMKEQVAQKVARNREQASGVGSRLEQLRQQVEQADRRVAQYKAANGLVSESGSLLAEQEISQLNAELATVKAEQASSDAAFAAANSQMARDGGGVTDALNSAVIAQLRNQKAQIATNVANLSASFGPKYPPLIQAKQQLAEIDAQIDQEVKRITSNVRAQSNVARQKTASVASSLGAAKARLAQNNAASVRLADLQRDADAAKALYESFLGSSKQTNAAEALIQPDVRVTAPASPPLQASSPKLLVNLLLGMIVGLVIGVAIAFVRDRWAAGLDTNDDIERYLGQQWLNSLPTLASSIDQAKTKDPMEAVIRHPMSRYTEAYRTLGASLLYQGGAHKKVIGITSALPREGKTTTSVCLARVLAMGGQRVMLLDSDLRRRSVTEALAPEAVVGLIEYLDGRASFEDTVIGDEATGMHFIPLAKGAHTAKSPFGSPEYEALMTRLRADYDVVILDTAPILAVVDTRMLLQQIDALCMLAHWRVTPIKAIRAAIHQVEAVGGRIDGVAMTLVNAKVQARSGYGDPSYYYTEMKDYYTE
jgi:succinoglycan biosynthesis transport protein ExoP